MTTLAVRVPDSLLENLDALIAEGRYANRTAAVRAALDRLVAEERRQAVDRAIVEGYARKPADTPDAFTRALAGRSIKLEPW
jgi:putative addiction module CopG family antidote